MEIISIMTNIAIIITSIAMIMFLIKEMRK